MYTRFAAIKEAYCNHEDHFFLTSLRDYCARTASDQEKLPI